MMKKLYIFSGLGADRRVFKYLDFSGYDVTLHLKITKLSKSMQSV